MTSRRTLKAAEAIREVVSMAILTDMRDPRVRDVTVTYVEVAPDMRQAKVHVSVMGDETRQNLSLRGLQNAAGFFQHKISKRIDTRYTPKLLFVLDKGVKHSILVAQMLNDLLPKQPPVDAEEIDDDDLEDGPEDMVHDETNAVSDHPGDAESPEIAGDEADEEQQADEQEADESGARRTV